MHRTWLLLLIILLTSAGYTANATDEGWEVVERCFGEATAPPEGWTFDGTLLLTSIGRLHAYRQEWETPRILVFDDGLPSHGALSPDGRWFATSEYERRNFEFSTTFYEKAIRVYSTGSEEQYIIPWENTFSIDRRQIGHRFYWLDQEHLLYSRGDTRRDETWFKINPFTQEIELWDSDLDPSRFVFDLAPDATKGLYTDWGLDYWILDRGEDEIQLSILNTAGWSPDSALFAAYTRVGFRAGQFVLFDSNGNLSETLLNVPDDTQIRYLFSNLWSSDTHYLLFTTDRLYLADMENQQVIDLCISADGLRSAVWSPDSSQFALTTYIQDDGIQIFDLAAWERYVVGYHDGSLIGWRGDD